MYRLYSGKCAMNQNRDQASSLSITEKNSTARTMCDSYATDEWYCGSVDYAWFPLNFLRAQPRIRPAVWGLCVHLRLSAWFLSDLCVIFLYFLRNSSVIFRRVDQSKWWIFSTDKHAQPNFMHNSCLNYALVGLCNRASLKFCSASRTLVKVKFPYDGEKYIPELRNLSIFLNSQ
jgi:hypothetical protein